MNAELLTALLLGGLGSAHCLGMCGPLALAVPSPRNTTGSRLSSALLLNGGRTLTYALLGAASGLFGRGLQLAGLQQAVSVGMGVAILLWLFLPVAGRPRFVSGTAATFVMRLRSRMAGQLRRTSPAGLLATGILNGLLPCGLVYLALAASMAQEGWLQGALFMAFFALGTWPALIGLRMAGGMLGTRWRSTLMRITPAVYALMAVLFIMRGLDLGIPFLSPDIPEPNSAVVTCAP